ncbi:unnamed protein product [Fraxinus pennsylvanica]|uniref:C2 tensin-type domain-containing protein n=1 Tax=Fraxinus pennsylvanica TaxID=56036 RepID=A0AAD1ZR02_9LAMI|nr:unnamed protein product [Fraxinus pennsylvanica]
MRGHSTFAVFHSCFSSEVLPEGIYQLYLKEIITDLHEEFPDSSFLAFNFREGEKRSQFAGILCEYDVTVMDYPRQYEGCPLLPLSLIRHFLRVSESWLYLGNSQNVVLFHCDRGSWLVLAFVLAGFLVYRKLHSGERKTLEMVYKEGPKKDCDVIKIDIQCLVQGDGVLECVHLDLDPEREVMMFRAMFNTAFIRSNILMLNSENLDILWDSKARFPKGFRAEVLFGDVETRSPSKAPAAILNGEEHGGLPIEAFSRVQELFGGVDWVDSSNDATLWLLK